MPNGAIFEGTKGTIVADFESRIILPNNNDGDLTYYKRRSKEQLLPLAGGTGEVPFVRPSSSARVATEAARHALGDDPDPRSDFSPVVLGPGGVPPEMLAPNQMIGHVRPGYVRYSVFQNDWLDACKGKNDKFAQGSSTKTQCDFDYSGTMMEEMLLALVSHRMGKKILYDPVAGRITNAPEANDYLKRQYRPGWTLNG
jgi:hypothetical protein